MFQLQAQNISTEERSVQAFDAIHTTSIIQAELYSGAPGQIEVITEDIPLKYIKTEVVNGTLKLTLDGSHSNKGKNNVSVKVKIPIRDIENLSADAAGSIVMRDEFEFDQLTINLNAASSCQLTANVDVINAQINAAATLRLTGKGKELVADVNAASRLIADEYEVEVAHVTANSMGRANIWVTKEIDASSNSMGRIRYKGDPIKTNISQSSMGKITHEEMGLKKL